MVSFPTTQPSCSLCHVLGLLPVQTPPWIRGSVSGYPPFQSGNNRERVSETERLTGSDSTHFLLSQIPPRGPGLGPPRVKYRRKQGGWRVWRSRGEPWLYRDAGEQRPGESSSGHTNTETRRTPAGGGWARLGQGAEQRRWRVKSGPFQSIRKIGARH